MKFVNKTTRMSRTKVRRPSGNVLEWRLQAAGVRALKALPEYVEDAKDVQPGTFTLAGDFNAARRSKQESVKAKATGIAAGEHDLRIYMAGGRLGLIEVKNAVGYVDQVQKKRHAVLYALGFQVQAIIKVKTEHEASLEFVRVVKSWL